MFDEHIEFFEGALVEQQLHPLARHKLAAVMLSRDALLAAAQNGPRHGGCRASRECPSSASFLVAVLGGHHPRRTEAGLTRGAAGHDADERWSLRTGLMGQIAGQEASPPPSKFRLHGRHGGPSPRRPRPRLPSARLRRHARRSQNGRRTEGALFEREGEQVPTR